MNDANGTDKSSNTASAQHQFQSISKTSGLSLGRKWLLAGTVLILAALAWFFLSTRAVVFKLEPSQAKVRIDSSLQLALGKEVLLLPGDYHYTVTAPGYTPQQAILSLGQETLSLTVNLEKLPGKLLLSSFEQGHADEEIIAPIELVGEHGRRQGSSSQLLENIKPGRYQLKLSHPLYQPINRDIEIRGRALTEQIKISLKPAYGTVNVSSITEAAELFIDDQAQPKLDGIKLAPGEHEFRLQHPQHKSSLQWLTVTIGQQQALHFPALTEVDALLKLSSSPSQASVTIDGQYRGRTPIEIELSPNKTHQISLFKAGHLGLNQDLSIASHSQKSLHLKLQAQLGSVYLDLHPSNAKVSVDGRPHSLKQGRLNLPSREHIITVSAAGFASISRKVLPSSQREQRLSIRLKTLEQQRHASLKELVTSPAGQQLKLFRPKVSFTMGASRREQGRRANEVQRKISLNRSFYLSPKEVSNSQFIQFDKQHSSSHVKGKSLNGRDQPVVNISWQQAALYCNWLSEQDKLAPFYQTKAGKVVGYNDKSTGYRLPSEAEWAWAGRLQNDGSMPKFSWGSRLTNLANTAQYHSNVADRKAAPVAGVVLSNYDDGFAVSAPAGSFKANHRGLYDMDGNVAEWVHDFYQIKTGFNSKPEANPMGPLTGKHHVIRGPSWSSGRLAELRMAFRDYGADAKPTVGFRIARTAL